MTRTSVWGQATWEDEASSRAHRVLFCDTGRRVHAERSTRSGCGAELDAASQPYITLAGSHELRFQPAVESVENLLSHAHRNFINA